MTINDTFTPSAPVKIYGVTIPVTRPWTVTNFVYQGKTPVGVFINGHGCPVEGGEWYFPIEFIERLMKGAK